jgi:hypothetical protein
MEKFYFPIFEGAAAIDDDYYYYYYYDRFRFNLIAITFNYTNKFFSHSPVEISSHNFPARMSVR